MTDNNYKTTEQADFESFESFFSGLPMKDERDAVKLYEQYIKSHITSIRTQDLSAIAEMVEGKEKIKVCACNELINKGETGYHDCGAFIANIGNFEEEKCRVLGYNQALSDILKDIETLKEKLK